MGVSGVGLLWGDPGSGLVTLAPPGPSLESPAPDFGGWTLREAVAWTAGSPPPPTAPWPPAGSDISLGNRSGLVCGPRGSLKTPFVWGGERGVCGAQQRWDSWTGPGGGE